MRSYKSFFASVIIVMIILTTSTQCFAFVFPTLDIPSNFSCSEVTNSTATLTWDSVPGATMYFICEVGGKTFTVNAPATSYTVTDLSLGRHAFKIKSVNNLRTTNWSNVLNVYIPNTTPTPLVIPSNFSYSDVTKSSVTLTWDTVPGATKYYICEVGKQSFIVDAPSTYLIVTQLSPGEHTFEIMSVKNLETTHWSDPLTVTIP